MTDPGFDSWLRSIATPMAQQYLAQGGDPSADPGPLIDRFIQEMDQGAQGQTLQQMYSKGLTPDQVSQAYSTGSQSANLQGAIQYLNQNRGESGGYVPPEYQQYIDSGDIIQSSTGDYTLSPKYNATMKGMVAQPLIGHQQQETNPGAFGFDPTRGFVTSPANLPESLGDRIGDIAPYAIAAAMGAGGMGLISAAGGGMGSLGNALFRTAGNAVLGKPFNPVSAATSLAGPVINATGFSLPGFGSGDYTSPTTDTSMADGGGDFSGFDPYYSPESGFAGLMPVGDGTYVDPSSGLIFDENGQSTGYTLNSDGTISGGGGYGGGDTGGGPSGGGIGGLVSSGLGAAGKFLGGMTPGQIAGLAGGVGAALYGMHNTSNAANQVGAAADKQAQSNLDLARTQSFLNNPNMVTPYGTSTYVMGPDGRPTLTQQLSPAEQAKLTATEQFQQGQLGIANSALPRLQQMFSQPFGLAGAPIQGFDPKYGIGSVQTDANFSGAPAMPGTGDAARIQAQNAAYANQTQYLDPQWAQKKSDLTSQLANQGITPGSDAYNRAMLNFNNSQQQAYDDARQLAVQQGLQAQTAQFGMGLSARQQGVNEVLNALQAHNAGVGEQAGISGQSTQLSNAGRQQQFGEYTTGQTLPISQLNSLLTGSQVYNPQFQATQGTNIATAPYYQAGVAQANIGQGNTQNLFNLAGQFAGGMFGTPQRTTQPSVG